MNFAITWKNLSPASWDPGIAMPGSRLAGLKIYHVIVIAGPTLSRHLISLQSKMAHQRIDISLTIEHIMVYQTIKLRKTENNTPKQWISENKRGRLQGLALSAEMAVQHGITWGGPARLRLNLEAVV